MIIKSHVASLGKIRIIFSLLRLAANSERSFAGTRNVNIVDM